MLECYQWDNGYTNGGDPIEAAADIMIYLLTYGYEMDINWPREIVKKVRKNTIKYPIGKVS